MAYTYTTVTVTDAWTEIAADVLTTKIIQIQHRHNPGKPDVEIMAADAEPASSAQGVSMLSGDVMTSGLIEDLGDSGKVWARTVKTGVENYNTEVLVVTV